MRDLYEQSNQRRDGVGEYSASDVETAQALGDYMLRYSDIFDRPATVVSSRRNHLTSTAIFLFHSTESRRQLQQPLLTVLLGHVMFVVRRC